MDPDFGSTTMHGLLDSMQHGNRQARDELFRRIEDRMRRLSRKMLGGFPAVREREETLDVMQSAMIRLMRSLDEIRPASTREFFGLATEQIRRELLDLVRYHQADKRPALKQLPGGNGLDSNASVVEPVQAADDSGDWQHWCDLHQAVETLSTEDREVFGLIYYHGWSKQEVADLLQVSERQARRLWVRACSKISEIIKQDLPDEQ